MARIGLISDTHGLLRPEAVSFLRGCDHIVHGGDIGHESAEPAGLLGKGGPGGLVGGQDTVGDGLDSGLDRGDRGT